MECDYRFFIDTRKLSEKLIEESVEHGDMTFRNSCHLMRHHPDEINYGNSYLGSKDKADKLHDNYYRR